MRLSDIMSHSGLSIYTEIALVIFLVVFAGILVWTFSKRNRKMLDDVHQYPLKEDQEVSAAKVGKREAQS